MASPDLTLIEGLGVDGLRDREFGAVDQAYAIPVLNGVRIVSDHVRIVQEDQQDDA